MRPGCQHPLWHSPRQTLISLSRHASAGAARGGLVPHGTSHLRSHGISSNSPAPPSPPPFRRAGDVGPDVVELVGDALLPLLQSDPAAFSQLGAALVQVGPSGHANRGVRWAACGVSATCLLLHLGRGH